MPEAVFDFPSIRSLMLGEDKPVPSKGPKCCACVDIGWIGHITFPSFAHSLIPCPVCGNPQAKPCP